MSKYGQQKTPPNKAPRTSKFGPNRQPPKKAKRMKYGAPSDSCGYSQKYPQKSPGYGGSD